MGELSLSDAWGRLHKIESDFKTARTNLHESRSQRRTPRGPVSPYQSSYNLPNQPAYASQPQAPTYAPLHKTTPGFPPVGSQLNTILSSLQSLGTKVDATLKKEKVNLKKYNNGARQLQSNKAAAGMLKQSSNIKEAVDQCKKILQKINTISKEVRSLLSLGPADINAGGGSIDTFVGVRPQTGERSHVNVLDEVLYQLNKNIDYLVKPPVEPNLENSEATTKTKPWDKVVYGGGYLDYLVVSTYYVDSSANVRKMINAAHNMRSKDGMYVVGKVYHNTGIGY